jgi:type I restriction enzyme S subunit
LRELILELAVRGLLVPQDPNDEPASALLTKIAAEKARLVSEGKIKSPKPLAKISEEEKPFGLPMGWEWERLGRLTYIEMGQSPSSSSYNRAEDGMPFFQGKADFGKIFPTPRYWCTEPQKIAYPDDVLLSVRAPVGSTNLNNIECCIGRGLAALRPLAETNCYFLLYLMRSFQTKLESFATGTTFAAVSKSDVESFPVPLPPLAEQQRIVAKVDELMQLCDLLEEKQSGSQAMHLQLVSCLLTTLTEASDAQVFQAAWSQIAANFDCLFTTENSIEQLKQTILQLAVMGKLVPQDPNDEPTSELLKKISTEKARLITEGKIKKQNPLSKISEQEKRFALPDSWEWVRLGDISADIHYGYTASSSTQSITGVKLLRITDIQNDAVNWSVHYPHLFS